MGFYKEVQLKQPTVMAFQWDGTEQAVDDLNTALGALASGPNFDYVNSTTMSYVVLGNPATATVDDVIVITIGANNDYADANEALSLSAFEAQYEDV